MVFRQRTIFVCNSIRRFAVDDRAMFLVHRNTRDRYRIVGDEHRPRIAAPECAPHLNCVFVQIANGQGLDRQPSREHLCRIEYRHQFQRSQQLRRVLSWLWAAPVLIILYEQLIRTGLSAHRAVLVTIGSAAVIAICFLVSAINRECTGRAQEKAGLLEHQQ